MCNHFQDVQRCGSFFCCAVIIAVILLVEKGTNLGKANRDFIWQQEA